MGVYLIGMHLIGVYFYLNGFSLHWRGAGVRLARPTFRSFAHLPRDSSYLSAASRLTRLTQM
jgi:hypothetical protein